MGSLLYNYHTLTAVIMWLSFLYFVHCRQCKSVWMLFSVVFCCCDASLPYLPSQRKISAVPVISLCWHYLLGVSADAWQNDIPDSSAALPDNSHACLIKKKIPNRILLMPLAVTPAIFFLSPLEKRCRPNTSRCPKTWKKESERKVFHISSWGSKSQRSIKVETSQKQFERKLWNTFMNSRFFSFSIIQMSECHDNPFGSPEGSKEMTVFGGQQAEAGGCLETAQTIVLTVAWADASPSVHNQKEAVISPAWRSQRGRYKAAAEFGLR